MASSSIQQQQQRRHQTNMQNHLSLHRFISHIHANGNSTIALPFMFNSRVHALPFLTSTIAHRRRRQEKETFAAVVLFTLAAPPPCRAPNSTSAWASGRVRPSSLPRQSLNQGSLAWRLRIPRWLPHVCVWRTALVPGRPYDPPSSKPLREAGSLRCRCMLALHASVLYCCPPKAAERSRDGSLGERRRGVL